jgi:Hydrogenase maturation factor
MPPLPVGKLPAQLLQRLFTKYVTADPRVVVGPQVGEDAAVLDMGDRYLVATTDPITFATDEMGWYALHVNANDLAVRGATPRWFMATVLLPEGKSQETHVEQLFAELAEACAAVGVSLVGGHTEVTGGLPRPIVVGAMLGEVAKDKLVTTGGAQVGDAVLLTKGVPLEGASIMARERGERPCVAAWPPTWWSAREDFSGGPASVWWPRPGRPAMWCEFTPCTIPPRVASPPRAGSWRRPPAWDFASIASACPSCPRAGGFARPSGLIRSAPSRLARCS